MASILLPAPSLCGPQLQQHPCCVCSCLPHHLHPAYNITNTLSTNVINYCDSKLYHHASHCITRQHCHYLHTWWHHKTWNTTVSPQHCITTTLHHHNTASPQHYHHNTASPQHCTTTTLHHHNTALPYQIKYVTTMLIYT